MENSESADNVITVGVVVGGKNNRRRPLFLGRALAIMEEYLSTSILLGEQNMG